MIVLTTNTEKALFNMAFAALAISLGCDDYRVSELEDQLAFASVPDHIDELVDQIKAAIAWLPPID